MVGLCALGFCGCNELNKEVGPGLEPGEEEAQEGSFHPFAEQSLCFLMHGQRFSG